MRPTITGESLSSNRELSYFPFAHFPIALQDSVLPHPRLLDKRLHPFPLSHEVVLAVGSKLNICKAIGRAELLLRPTTWHH